MNFNITLLSIFLILVLYIPGYFFKRFYYTGKFTKQFTAGNFTERFVTSLFWGLVLQCLSFLLANITLKISYNDVKKPLSSFYEDICNSRVPNCSFDDIKHAMFYMSITIILAMGLGTLCHKVVRLFRFDIKYPILKFSNYWFYYFRGEVTLLMKENTKRGKLLSTEIDIVARDTDTSTKLYSGLLIDYTTSSVNGELETIAITSAQRWSNTEKLFKPIKGDFLILPYNRILNFNIRFTYEAKNSDKLTTQIKNVIGIIGLVGTLCLIIGFIYYFYGDLSWWRIVLGTISSLTTWLMLLALVYYIVNKVRPLPQDPKAAANVKESLKNWKAVILIFIGFIILFGWISNLLLQLV